MTIPESVHTDALKVRGFDKWIEEGFPNTCLKSIPFETPPLFFYLTFFTLTMIFVLDEHYFFWAAEGKIDLSEIGLEEFNVEAPRDPAGLN